MRLLPQNFGQVVEEKLPVKKSKPKRKPRKKPTAKKKPKINNGQKRTSKNGK